MEREPNHICVNCGKAYYACDYCDRSSYRRVACSVECFEESGWKYIVGCKDPKSTRTDLTQEQKEELDKKPIEEVRAKSEAELFDYSEQLKEIGFEGVMDIINNEIEESEGNN